MISHVARWFRDRLRRKREPLLTIPPPAASAVKRVRLEEMVQTARQVPLYPALTTAEWRERVAGWKPRMSVWVSVSELAELVDRIEAVEEWACSHVEGDGLRAILWPEREP